MRNCAVTENVACSGDSRMKKLGGGTAGPKKKVGGQHKMSLLHCDFPL